MSHIVDRRNEVKQNGKTR